MAASRRTSTSDIDKRSDEAFLKTRVRELEDEVSRLKKRLDDLRKAKNTTVHKREREVIHVATPFSKRESKTETKETKETRETTNVSTEELRKQFAEEREALKKQYEEQFKCNHEREIQDLRQHVADLKDENISVKNENQTLRDRVEALATQLSIKEATWCETEEKLKIEIQSTWQEKYRKWMEATEAKIMELQEANILMRGYLKNQKPGGKDPSKQDPD